MRIHLVGVNYRGAPVAVREKAAVCSDAAASLASLRDYVPHGVILSTCNRTEIYTAGGEDSGPSRRFLAARLGSSPTGSLDFAYTLEDKEAVEHLFRVACGLDSMIVGEYEVLGQVRQALETAESAGMVNLALRHIFNGAIRTGRRARDETAISKSAMSVSSVAVDLAQRVVGDIGRCKMLVIGAGEAGRLVAKVARDRGIRDLVIANRTRDRAADLAKALGGVSASLDSLPEELLTADIVVTCAGAPHSILDSARVAEAMSRRDEKPLVIIDIAIPRNVSPGVARVSNVFLYNIDDLTGISNVNRKQREGEIAKAEKIIAEEMARFGGWWGEYEVKPLVSALMTKAEHIRTAQLNLTLKKLHTLTEEDRESIEAMTRSIVTKILKEPVQFIKENGNGNVSEMVGEIFGLGRENHS